jgi:type I restriction enzyme S subunit
VKIKNGVPEGWKKAATPEIIDINPSERIQKGTEVWYVPMSSLSSTDMTVERSGFERRVEYTTVKFRNGDVLFARITPCLENGKTGFVNFLDENEPACGSTEFIVLRGLKVSPYFTYCLARSYDFRENAIKSMVGSSGRQRVQTNCFNDFILPLPPKVMLGQFDEAVLPCFKQIQILCKQNESLSKARDLLLPRLTNGEIIEV